MGLFNKDTKNNSDYKASTEKLDVVDSNINNRLYLVDYENVSDAGLVGVDQLSNHDVVVIFYGSKVKSIAYESLIAITGSSASIEHVKAEKTAKNYLDFQLTTYLGYKLGQKTYSEIYIISKDSGFDAVVDFWSEKRYSIKRQESVVVTEKVDEKKTENKPSGRSRRTNTKRAGNSSKTATKSDRTASKSNTQKKVTKSQSKDSKPNARPTATDKQKAELRAALKGAGLSAPDYKKVYDAFASCENTSAYNNKLQKAFGNDKTSVIYKATSKIFENAKK